MRFRTMTVAGLLLAIAILAVDMAAVVSLRRDTSWHYRDTKLLLMILPSINALAIGLYRLQHQLILGGEGTPFLVGFEAAGWLAVAVALMAKFGFENQVFLYERWAEAHLVPFWSAVIMWDGRFTQVHWDEIKVGLDILALA